MFVIHLNSGLKAAEPIFPLIYYYYYYYYYYYLLEKSKRSWHQK